jgi:phosphatidylinositol glycan class V
MSLQSHLSHFCRFAFRNVGFLRYWTVSQIPNFLLASPILYSSLRSIYDFAKPSPSGSQKEGSPLKTVRNDLVGYLGLHIALAYILITSSHTQIALRTMGSNPMFWWGLTQQAHEFRHGSKESVVKIRRFGRMWLVWVLVWTVWSLILWAGFYPPA